MATNAPDECSLCTEKYNEEEKAPRSLPCSHCFCAKCIDNLIHKQTKVCPYCRQRFQAKGARDIGINTGVLDLLKLLKEKEQKLLELQGCGSASSSKQTTLKELKKETRMFSQKIKGSYQDAAEKIKSTIQSMKELRDNLLHELRLMQDDILTKVKKLLEKTIQKVQYIEEQIKTIEDQKEAMRSKQSKMEEAITKLDAANTFTQAGPLIDKAVDANSKAQKSLDTFNHVISNNEKALPLIEKVAKDTWEKMSVIQEVLNSPVEGEVEMQFLPHLQQLTIQEKLPQQVTMDDLRERNEAVLRLIRQGKVYAEQEEGGRRRHARMTLDEENRICLHYLSDERLLPLPHEAHLLQHDDVMSVVNPSSARRAFLDLGTDEESLGRIIINLKPNSKRAQNFYALCLSLLGPSYVKTKILEVRWKDVEGEAVMFGDYEFNDGRGGKEVISGAGQEVGGAWEGPWVAGSVRGWYIGSAAASQFSIVTKDHPKYTLLDTFGNVDTGLNVVQDVVSRYSDIKTVKIIDCGILLPL